MKLLARPLGPLLFAVALLVDIPDLSPAGEATLGIVAWVALWWVTDTIPIAATALLPLALFPLCGVMPLKAATAAFANPILFLLLGGFLLAAAIERVRLHERIALRIIYALGSEWPRVLLGFMLASAFLSMWISNTATAVMILPVGMAVYSQLRTTGEERLRMGRSLMLAIAYGCSIGGTATLIGTPTNVIFSGMAAELYGEEITFTQWLVFGLPYAIIFLMTAWAYLAFVAFPVGAAGIPGGRGAVAVQLAELGRMGHAERAVLVVFVLTALAWITRPFLLANWLPGLNDTIIALVAALSLFLLPSGNGDRNGILDWPTAERIPWGILLLFGGGLVLAAGFADSGLAKWIGAQLGGLGGLPLLLLLLGVVTAVNFLTELTSNVATATMLLPVLGALALAIDLHPYPLMVGATLAASCAFMLPVATPPNAVVFGSGLLTIPQMLRAGFWLNMGSILLATLFVYWYLPVVWAFSAETFPALFKTFQK